MLPDVGGGVVDPNRQKDATFLLSVVSLCQTTNHLWDEKQRKGREKTGEK